MRLSKFSHELIAMVFVAAVFVIALNNSQFTGMVISEADDKEIIPQEESLEEGCEYVDVAYTENVCVETEYDYTIKSDQFLNSRFAMEHICTDVIMITNNDNGAGTWKLGYVFEIEGQTYQTEPISQYIMPGEVGRFRFERSCEEDTAFDGVYYIIEEPLKQICGPITKYKKEIKCGLQSE